MQADTVVAEFQPIGDTELYGITSLKMIVLASFEESADFGAPVTETLTAKIACACLRVSR